MPVPEWVWSATDGGHDRDYALSETRLGASGQPRPARAFDRPPRGRDIPSSGSFEQVSLTEGRLKRWLIVAVWRQLLFPSSDTVTFDVSDRQALSVTFRKELVLNALGGSSLRKVE